MTAGDGDNVHGRRLADQAYSGIIGFITAERLNVGDRLPPEVRLAEMFGISRTIIREALVHLSSDGIVEVRRGAGSYVKKRPSNRLIAYTSAPKLWVAFGTYEVRFAIESEGARLAATRRSAEEMRGIEAAFETLKAALLTGASAHVEDLEFHRAILQSTANAAFIHAFNAISGKIDLTMRAGVDGSQPRPSHEIEAMVREHEAITEAIRLRDVDNAALAMHWHLWEGRNRVIA